ncbi:hypothetical protein EVAR_31634_1 [Eumeta japonica]|uniref:Uncharacterized protein n=1 Tax=Eumeta variegata TaxID=151549 RepID=A0A4C1W010_EUMVA|nr:hypothetical protein EVAR_31634_1 [Eumeta japonica]
MGRVASAVCLCIIKLRTKSTARYKALEFYSIFPAAPPGAAASKLAFLRVRTRIVPTVPLRLRRCPSFRLATPSTLEYESRLTGFDVCPRALSARTIQLLGRRRRPAAPALAPPARAARS